MSDQGDVAGPRKGQGDDWWSQLYDPRAPDAGRSAAGDTIDDRFAEARAVGASGHRAPLHESGADDAAPGEAAVPAAGREPDGPSPSGTGPVPDATGPPGDPAAPDDLADADPADTAEPHVSGGHGEAYPDAVSGEPEAPVDPPPRRPERTLGRSVRENVGDPGRQRPAPDVAGTTRRRLLPPEPGALADADPGALADLVPDTVLDGARHEGLVMRAVSGRGGSARQRGEPRGDALLTSCFGTGADALLFAAVAVGAGTAPTGPRAARELCRTIGEAVGRSRSRLVEDIGTDRRATLSSGLKRLTDRCYGRLRAQAAALSLPPEVYTADLRCLLLPVHPACRARVVFGTGDGGLFRLRDGHWADLEPEEETRGGAQPTSGPSRAGGVRERFPDQRAPEGDGGNPAAVSPPFRFRLVGADPGDVLLLCGTGLAVPLRGDPAFAGTLASSWSRHPEPPDLAAFLTDVQHPAPAYGDDRTAVAVWHPSGP